MRHRLRAGFGLTGVILALNLIVTLISVPIFVRHWGEAAYGEWVALTNLTLSLSLLHFGVQNYVTNRLITAYKNGDLPNGTRVFRAGVRLYALFAATACLITVGIAAAPETLTSLRIVVIPPAEGQGIILLQGGMVALALVIGYLLIVLIAVERYPRRLLYSIGEIAARGYAPLMVALFGGTPLGAATAMLALTIGYGVLGGWEVRRHSPFPLGWRGVTWGEAARLLPPSCQFFAVALLQMLITSGVILILASAAGGEAVAAFNAALILTNLARSIIGQFLNTVYPEVAGVAATEAGRARLADWYVVILKWACAVCWLVAAGVAAFGVDVVRLWTGSDTLSDGGLNLLLALALALNAPLLVIRMFGFALTRQGALLRVEALGAGITLTVGIVLAAADGARGMAAALCVGGIIGAPLAIWVGARWTETSARRLRRELWRGLPIAALVFGLSPVLALTSGIVTRAALLVAMSAVGAVWLRTGVSRET